MSYPPLGYSYPSAASTLASSQLLSNLTAATASGTAAAATTIATSCCETGRPIMTDPHTGQTVCSCQYNSSLLSYSRVAAGLPDGVYPTAYATQGYVPFGTDPSAFYSPLNSAYDLKDNTDAWRNLSQPTPCYPYDPTMAGYPYGSSYGGVDLNAQRKNATREATSTLKAWLHEHIKNPYPTKGEKIMLAIITKMTLTQVSTWFANARRRLKKENKMVWSPRNRCEDGRDKLDSDMDDDDEEGADITNRENNETNKTTSNNTHGDENSNTGTDLDSSQDDILIKSNEEAKSDEDEKDGERTTTTTSRCLSPGGGVLGGTTGLNQTSNHILPPPAALSSPSSSSSSSLSSQTSPGHTLGGSGIIHHQHLGNNNQISSHPSSTSPVQLTSNSMNNSQKPRIWSLAHTATSSSPPLGRRSPPSMPIHVTPKHHSGQGSGGYHSAMSTLNSLRQWVDGNGFSSSVSSHPGLSLPSHPAYGLTAHTMSTSSQSSATITSPSNQVDTPPATPPTAHSRPPGGYPVHMSMGHTLGYPSAGTFSKLSNGLPTRLPGVDARDLSDMKSDAAKALDRDERTKTAFKPVTKSKFGEVVKV